MQATEPRKSGRSLFRLPRFFKRKPKVDAPGVDSAELSRRLDEHKKTVAIKVEPVEASPTRPAFNSRTDSALDSGQKSSGYMPRFASTLAAANQTEGAFTASNSRASVVGPKASAPPPRHSVANPRASVVPKTVPVVDFKSEDDDQAARAKQQAAALDALSGGAREEQKEDAPTPSKQRKAAARMSMMNLSSSSPARPVRQRQMSAAVDSSLTTPSSNSSDAAPAPYKPRFAAATLVLTTSATAADRKAARKSVHMATGQTDSTSPADRRKSHRVSMAAVPPVPSFDTNVFASGRAANEEHATALASAPRPARRARPVSTAMDASKVRRGSYAHLARSYNAAMLNASANELDGLAGNGVLNLDESTPDELKVQEEEQEKMRVRLEQERQKLAREMAELEKQRAEQQRLQKELAAAA